MYSASKIEIYKELQRELEERKQKVTKPFFTEDYVSIEYVSASGWIYVDWKG